MCANNSGVVGTGSGRCRADDMLVGCQQSLSCQRCFNLDRALTVKSIRLSQGTYLFRCGTSVSAKSVYQPLPFGRATGGQLTKNIYQWHEDRKHGTGVPEMYAYELLHRPQQLYSVVSNICVSTKTSGSRDPVDINRDDGGCIVGKPRQTAAMLLHSTTVGDTVAKAGLQFTVSYWTR